MADIDFSNAILEPYKHNPASANWFTLYSANNSIKDVNGNNIGTITNQTNPSRSVDSFTSILSGSMSASGTEMYLYNTASDSGGIVWKISNISFASGDTFRIQFSLTIS